MAVEIKFSLNPSLSKGFYTVMDDLKLDKGFENVPKGEGYRLDEKVEVGGIRNFIEKVLPRLNN